MHLYQVPLRSDRASYSFDVQSNVSPIMEAAAGPTKLLFELKSSESSRAQESTSRLVRKASVGSSGADESSSSTAVVVGVSPSSFPRFFFSFAAQALEFD